LTHQRRKVGKGVAGQPFLLLAARLGNLADGGDAYFCGFVEESVDAREGGEKKRRELTLEELGSLGHFALLVRRQSFERLYQRGAARERERDVSTRANDQCATARHDTAYTGHCNNKRRLRWAAAAGKKPHQNLHSHLVVLSLLVHLLCGGILLLGGRLLGGGLLVGRLLAGHLLSYALLHHDASEETSAEVEVE
jgi:hypothetical protein